MVCIFCQTSFTKRLCQPFLGTLVVRCLSPPEFCRIRLVLVWVMLLVFSVVIGDTFFLTVILYIFILIVFPGIIVKVWFTTIITLIFDVRVILICWSLAIIIICATRTY